MLNECLCAFDAECTIEQMVQKIVIKVLTDVFDVFYNNKKLRVMLSEKRSFVPLKGDSEPSPLII